MQLEHTQHGNHYTVSARKRLRLCSNKTSCLLRWFVLIRRLIKAICGVILLSSTSPPSPPLPSSFLLIQTLMAALCGKLLATIGQLEKDYQYYCIWGEDKRHGKDNLTIQVQYHSIIRVNEQYIHHCPCNKEHSNHAIASHSLIGRCINWYALLMEHLRTTG